MNAVLSFVVVVMIVSVGSYFLHEAVHEFTCSYYGGDSTPLHLNSTEAQELIGYWGLLGASAVRCSINYPMSSTWRELFAYGFQFLLIGIGVSFGYILFLRD